MVVYPKGKTVDPYAIRSAVGANAPNEIDDQQKIIDLLSNISPSEGGSVGPLFVSVSPTPTALINAIRNFQLKRRTKGEVRVVDGRVDPGGTTWKLLRRLSGLPAFQVDPLDLPAPLEPADIYCIDALATVDPALGKNWLELIATQKPNEILLLCSSIPNMVAQVKREAKNRKIRRLVMLGHGSPGMQVMGGGVSSMTSFNEALVLGAVKPNRSPGTPPDEILGRVDHFLFELQGLFTPDATVTLTGCNVAAMGQNENLEPVDGKILLQRVSRALGGVDVEGGDLHNSSSREATGNVYRCRPLGCVIARRATFRELAVELINYFGTHTLKPPPFIPPPFLKL